MASMSELGEIYHPTPRWAEWHEKRFKAFEMLQQVARSIRSLA
jgi:D-ribulokinase